MKNNNLALGAGWVGALMAGLALLVIMEVSAFAQQLNTQQGHVLDANPRVGSLGVNTRVRLDPLVPRVNLMITGNVRGGTSFQGPIPYNSIYEFGATLGSSALSDFRRDSVGLQDLAAGGALIAPQQVYIDPSRQVARSFGTGVVQTPRLFSQAAGRLLPSTRLERVQPYRPVQGFSYIPSSLPTDVGREPRLARYDPAAPVNPLLRTSVPLTQAQRLRQLSFLQLPEPVALGSVSPVEGEPIADAVPGSSFSGPFDEQASSDDFYSQLQLQLEEMMVTDLTGAASPANPLAGPGPSAPVEGEVGVLGPPGSQAEASEEEDVSAAPVDRVPLTRYGSTVSLERLAARSRWQFEQYMHQGEALMQEGHYYKASKRFGLAAIWGPDNPMVAIAQAHALFGAGEFMSSAYYLGRALQMQPELAQASFDLRKLFGGDEALAKRMTDLDRWLERTGDPNLRFLKGYVQMKTDQAPAARHSLTETQRERPEAPAVQLLLKALEDADG